MAKARFALALGVAVFVTPLFCGESAGFFSFDFFNGGTKKTEDVSLQTFGGNFNEIARLVWKEYYNGERRIDLALCAGDTAREKIAAAADEIEFAKLTNEVLGRCLDAQSRYSTRAETEDANRNDGGVGVSLTKTGQGTAVAEVFPDTPAYAAGIRMGDVLLAIDGKSVAEVPLGRLRTAVEVGKEGESVALTMRRDDAVHTIVLVRRNLPNFPPQSSSAWIFPEFMYVRFGELIAGYDLFYSFSALEDGEKSGTRKVVFDLRSTKTGVVPAICFVGLFVNDPRHRVATKQGAVIGNQADNFPAGLCPVPGWPVGRFYRAFDKIVILVNGETAAGAEIIALAMQEQEIGAVVVGTKTAKNGAAIGTFQLPIGSLRMTVGAMRAGERKRFVRDGVTPDIIFSNSSTSFPTKGDALSDIDSDPQFRDAVDVLRK